MGRHNEIGKTGEKLAAAYLENLGFDVLETNWKYERCEVDIIASKEGTLHFVEVKTQSAHSLAFPEKRVDRQKIGRMKRVAEYYLAINPHWKFIQFDIISVEMQPGQPVLYFMIEDVW